MSVKIIIIVIPVQRVINFNISCICHFRAQAFSLFPKIYVIYSFHYDIRLGACRAVEDKKYNAHLKKSNKIFKYNSLSIHK